jgi:hypothetical protein
MKILALELLASNEFVAANSSVERRYEVMIIVIIFYLFAC